MHYKFFLFYASPLMLGSGGNVCSSGMRINPNERSYFPIFSSSARNNRLACSGAKTMRDCTPAFGIPGITRIKSRINSELEWVIIARLAYVPCATSSFNSI